MIAAALLVTAQASAVVGYEGPTEKDVLASFERNVTSEVFIKGHFIEIGVTPRVSHPKCEPYTQEWEYACSYQVRWSCFGPPGYGTQDVAVENRTDIFVVGERNHWERTESLASPEVYILELDSQTWIPKPDDVEVGC